MEVFSLSNKKFMSKEAENAVRDITEIMRPVLPGYTQLDIMAAASLLKGVGGVCNPILDYDSALKTIDEENAGIIKNYTKIDVVWEQLNELITKYSNTTFDEILLNLQSEDKFGIEDIPSSIAELGIELMGIKEEDKVLHLGCRSGMTLGRIANKYENVNLVGINESEEHSSEFNIAQLRTQAFNNPVILINDSIVNAEEYFNDKFDKVFCSGPWGFKVRSYVRDGEKNPKALEKRYHLKGGLSADWLYALIMMDLLKDDGKAIGLFPAACLFTNIDKDTREELLRKQKIKAVITLPPKMFTFTSVNLVMVVFENNSYCNEGVRLVDASKLCVNQRRQNVLTQDHIDAIVDALDTDSDYSKFVSLETLKDNNFILSPERYLVAHDDDKDGEPLGNIVSFGRSVMIKAVELDKLDTAKDTGKFYMRLSEIKDGVISENLPHLTHIEEKDIKSILVDKDIILSRNGAPFKIAMYRAKDNEEVLPVGNLYILKANEEKVNPIYLKAYLESSKGIAKLTSCLTGITIQIISLESLKKIRIPLPSIEEQNRIADKYEAILEEIEILRLKTENAKDRLKNILEA